MTYLATDLITRSWYLSGIVARNLETVSGDQMSDGLMLLNILLDFKASDTRLIPYFTYYQGTFIAGQETYFIPNLYEVESMTFNIDFVRYSMMQVTRTVYFGTGRVNNISSLPYNYHVERQEGGALVYVYFLPVANYVFNISGKFGLTDVALNTDLSTVYDQFYIEYLRYALAQFMCMEYDIAFSPEKTKMLMTYEKKLQDVAPPDLRMTKMSTLNTQTGLNWGDVNIGRGWRP